MPDATTLPPVPNDEGGPVFAEPWQAHAFALAVELETPGYSLGSSGLRRLLPSSPKRAGAASPTMVPAITTRSNAWLPQSGPSTTRACWRVKRSGRRPTVGPRMAAR